MSSSIALTKEARAMRAKISRSNEPRCVAHRQMALRRIQTVILLAERNAEAAQAAMAEARFHAQFVFSATCA